MSLLLQINMYRHIHHLPSVIQTQPLCIYAEHRMIQSSLDWSHNGFYAHRPYIHMVENLSKGFSDDQVIEKWKQSPSHNNNLLSKILYVCIQSGDIHGTHYVVMEGRQ